jgi:glycosyltransferase involved in cell wall biosynthesis
MTRPRVLLIKPILPYPPDQGTRVVSFGLLEALREPCDVTVLTRMLDEGEAAHVAALTERGVRVVTVFPQNRRQAWARYAYRAGYALRSLLGLRSLKRQYDCPGALVAKARELARESFDLVIVEYWQMAEMLAVFPRDRTVLMTHDIDRQVARDHAALESPLQRVRRAWQRALEAREESAAYRRARRVWALTPRDADAVRRLSGGSATVAVFPFGLAEPAFVSEPSPGGSGEVLFLGAMQAPFNRDAVIHLADDIGPALRDIPGLRLVIVGGALPPAASALAGEAGVEVVGHTPEPGIYLKRAECLIVPLRYGGGLRIRIIEALAAGLPVVCSPVAVAGMDLDEVVLLAANAGEYRAHIARLLADPAFRATVARRGIEAARARYGPKTRIDGVRGLVFAALTVGGDPTRSSLI